jgi:N,N-dimethylformamidase
MNVLGYLDRWSVQRGESLELKVSTSAPEFRVDIVRYDRYFSEPDLDRDHVVASSAAGVYSGRVQDIPIGSWASVPTLQDIALPDGFTFQCWLQPFMVGHSVPQCVVSGWDAETGRGFQLTIETDGHLSTIFGPGDHAPKVRSEEPVIANRWYFVALRFDPQTGVATLDVNTCKRRWLSRLPSRSTSALDGVSLASGTFLFGASQVVPVSTGRLAPRDCLNGKIDRPALWARPLTDDELERIENGSAVPTALAGCLAVWDLSREVSTDKLVDASGNGHHGVAVNRPMRAVVGANWDGTATAFAQNPAHYGAIAFHQDDLDDCGWETDLVIETDPSWRTGIYAARLQADGDVDYVPFYVRPRQGERKAKVLFLAPTNTYLAYGNEKLITALWDDPNFVEKSTDSEVVIRPMDQYLLDHPELGASIYDRHPDGTGICYSTRLRPLLTMRPQYVMWMHGLPRHFSADLYLIEWLESNGIDYDVATDEDLHVLGLDLLDGYSVVLTGGHPEYWTYDMLEALERYLEQRGKLMYLGGNGFYWVTGMDAESPHFIEVRRGVSGIRAWTSHPGEVTLSTTGEMGGLWRHRGKTPNSLCGVGFASEGWGGAPGYVQTEQRSDPRAAFIFEGIAPDEIIGDFGFIMGGAAGDEIDRVDYALGTPEETLRLATTELRHSDYYQLVVEDCSFVLPGMGGTEEPRVRSDITYLEDVNGGAVFSVGSINWVGSLMWNGGKNNVSTMTLNVLRAFAELE